MQAHSPRRAAAQTGDGAAAAERAYEWFDQLRELRHSGLLFLLLFRGGFVRRGREGGLAGAGEEEAAEEADELGALAVVG